MKKRVGVGLLVLAVLPTACAPSIKNRQDEPSPPRPLIAQVPLNDLLNDQSSAQMPTRVRKEGWVKFDKSKLEIKHARTQVDDGTRAFFTVYVPRSPLKISLKCRDFEEGCQEDVLGPDYVVKELVAYDSNRRAFALRAVLAGADPRLQDVSARRIVSFVDKNGDGIFESLPGAFEFEIPAWAR